MKVKDCMIKQLVTLRPHQSLQEAAKVMTQVWVSGTPVINDEGILVGILSEADLLHHLGRSLRRERSLTLGVDARLCLNHEDDSTSEEDLNQAFKNLSEVRVQDIMIRDVLTIGPDEEVIEAARLMGDYRINRLPVVEAGTLIGLVTRGDIISKLTEAYLGPKQLEGPVHDELSIKEQLEMPTGQVDKILAYFSSDEAIKPVPTN